ncbi:hypothetical protein GGX14DRAFT_393603 [Mycena pura]|uniref:Uncharacterized protein n=1 Tax=Mycena pura TaxID=153505 RepID=A0AAD6YGR8_9AGAR|nr:hypothetical protein GGX14DRAFT_393603 [Mycena pura]
MDFLSSVFLGSYDLGIDYFAVTQSYIPPLCRLQRPNVYTSHPSGADANGARVQLLTNVRATCKGACKGRRRQSEAMQGADWTTAINMCKGHPGASGGNAWYVRAWCLRTTAINIQADAAKYKSISHRAGADTARMQMLPGCGARAQKCAQYAKGAQGPAEAMGVSGSRPSTLNAGRTDVSGSRPSNIGRRAAPMQTVLGHSGACAGQAKVRAGCKQSGGTQSPCLWTTAIDTQVRTPVQMQAVMDCNVYGARPSTYKYKSQIRRAPVLGRMKTVLRCSGASAGATERASRCKRSGGAQGPAGAVWVCGGHGCKFPMFTHHAHRQTNISGILWFFFKNFGRLLMLIVADDGGHLFDVDTGVAGVGANGGGVSRPTDTAVGAPRCREPLVSA